MRPMGAVESNMNFFAKRLKGRGYSWSADGVDAMTSTIIHRYEGTLPKAIHDSFGPGHAKRKEKKHPVIRYLAYREGKQSSRSNQKPYTSFSQRRSRKTIYAGFTWLGRNILIHLRK